MPLVNQGGSNLTKGAGFVKAYDGSFLPHIFDGFTSSVTLIKEWLRQLLCSYYEHWDIDYNSDNWETESMTILVTWTVFAILVMFFSWMRCIFLYFFWDEWDASFNIRLAIYPHLDPHSHIWGSQKRRRRVEKNLDRPPCTLYIVHCTTTLRFFVMNMGQEGDSSSDYII